MAARVNVDPAKLLQALRETVFKKATDDELLALVVVANEYGLNPFLKEIYAFPAKGGGIVPMVPIDGWIKMVNRAESFEGVEFFFADDSTGSVYSCTCTLFIKGKRPTAITEYIEECFRDTEPWKKMPRRMIRHKALMQCARVAFGFSGVKDEDEANDIRAVEIQVETERRRSPREIQSAKSSQESDFAPVGISRDPAPDYHTEMQSLLEENGLTFTILQMWGDQSGSIDDATKFGSLQEIPSEVLERLLKSRKKMVESLRVVKEGMAR